MVNLIMAAALTPYLYFGMDLVIDQQSYPEFKTHEKVVCDFGAGLKWNLNKNIEISHGIGHASLCFDGTDGYHFEGHDDDVDFKVRLFRIDADLR